MISVVVGLIGMSLVFVVEHLGTVFEMALSLRSVVEGPLLGVFVLGMMFPWVGRRPVIIATLGSLVAMSCLVLGSQWKPSSHRHLDSAVPTTLDRCPYPLNETVAELMTTAIGSPPGESVSCPNDEVFLLFRISVMHFTLIGTLLTIGQALAVSLASGDWSAEGVDPRHVIAPIRRYKLLSIRFFLQKK